MKDYVRIAGLLLPMLCLTPSVSAQDEDLVVKQARVYFQQGEWENAAQLLKKDMNDQADPDRIELLGDVYGARKEWSEARAVYRILVDRYPNNANYHFKYAGVLGMQALENKMRALTLIDDLKKHFLLAANLDPKHLEVRWALIDLYLELPGFLGGSEEKALEVADELESIRKVEGLLAKGYIAEVLEKDEASAYYKEAFQYAGEIKPQYPRKNIHYQLGKISARYGWGPELGIYHLLTFESRHEPADLIEMKWTYLYLSKLYKNRGNRERAAKYLKKALREDPEFEEARNEMQAAGAF